jgi:hypothetical protein
MMRLRRNETSVDDGERERREEKESVHSRDGKEKERVKKAARWAGSGGLEELLRSKEQVCASWRRRYTSCCVLLLRLCSKLGE